MSVLSQTRNGFVSVISKITVSRGLTGLALAVLMLIAGATTQQLLSLRAAVMVDTDRHLTRLDMVFAEHTGRAVETVDFVLLNAIETLQAARHTPPVNANAINAVLARRIEGVRQLIAIGLTDAAGKMILSSKPEATGYLGASVLSATSFHATHPDGGLRISEPLRLPDQAWTVLLTRGINAPDGSFEGIAIALVSLAYFQDFFRSVELDDRGAIVLHHRDGTVLTRYPPADAVVGTSFADLPPFKDVLSKALFGSVLMTSPVDGSLRLVAIRALRVFPLAVNVSVDVNQTLAAWRGQAMVFILAAAAVSLSTGGLLLVLARRSRKSERLVIEYARAKEEAERANIGLRQQIAERERAEAALSQAQRSEAVGQLTGGVAHDFNNLLTIVLSNTGMLERTQVPDARSPARLAAIRTAAERGAILTGQLLAFARRQKLSPRPVDVNGIITGMEGLLHSALGNYIGIDQKLNPALHRAMIDPTQIELVILNLVINARDAMPTGGTVTIETNDLTIQTDSTETNPGPNPGPNPGDYVTISVRDTGDGMAPDVLAKVFEPFFTTKPPGSGSGLGLSQVLGTTQQLGGDVRIISVLGSGTTVTVFLPRANVSAQANSAAAPSAVPEPAKAGYRATILVVDDDAGVRSAVAEMLDGLGYHVHEAASGAEALELLRTSLDVDVLLTDVAMPLMTGPALARAAGLMRPDLPVVFMSGYANPHEMAEDGENRAFFLERLVQKPFRPSQLTERLEAALARRAVVDR